MSDGQNDFADKGGEALNMDDGDGFSDGGEVKAKQAKAAGGKGQKDMKGEKLDNQPYDLAVEVNDDDSEEIESDEEEDEVNQMNEVGRSVPQAQASTAQ